MRIRQIREPRVYAQNLLKNATKPENENLHREQKTKKNQQSRIENKENTQQEKANPRGKREITGHRDSIPLERESKE